LLCGFCAFCVDRFKRDKVTGPVLVVMAAGIGSRYGGLKQVEPIGSAGEMIVDYSIFDAIRAGFERVVVVIRRDIEADFTRAVADRIARHIRIDYAFQELDDLPAGLKPPADRARPWGTGHAILAAEPFVSGPFAVINADDFYGLASFHTLFDYLRTPSGSEPPEYALVGYPLRQTLSAHGSVSRAVCDVTGEDRLQRIREIKRIETTESGGRFTDDHGRTHLLPGDTIVSMNMWGFTPGIFEPLRRLFVDFLQRHAGGGNAEFLIPEAMGTLVDRGLARVRVLHSSSRWFGITYRQDRIPVARGINDLIVSGEYPQPLWT